MNGGSALWQFVGGIGLFLFAMQQLEMALRRFTGPALRRFLRDRTRNRIEAAGVGALATAVVQSSSLIGLIVLAFVGASVIALENALGVIFGANLGTTVTGWIVTTLGFKLDLDAISLPLIGLGSIAVVSLRNRAAEFGRLMAALGFLLAGLALMKSSVAGLAAGYDISGLAGLAGWQFLVFGIVAAAIMQSSSAVMMLTLTALHAGVIDLYDAAALAIGADLGTTSTIVLGAMRGVPGKKRVALAHVIFNLTTDAIAFLALVPLLNLVRMLGIADPLLSLVAFHSLFNLIGVLLFLPMLRPFARFLERRFLARVPRESLLVAETPLAVPDAALLALRGETAHILARVIDHNLKVYEPPLPAGLLPFDPPQGVGFSERSFEDLYRANKLLEGEIVSFALRLQARPLDEAQGRQLAQLLSAVRNAVHSAKSLRDIRHNLDELSQSQKQALADYQQRFRGLSGTFYAALFELRRNGNAALVPQDFEDLAAGVRSEHDRLHELVYADVQNGLLDVGEISSLLNVNREVLNSQLALLAALRAYCLDTSGLPASMRMR